MELLFIVCAALLFYVYAVYPAAMALLGLFNRKVSPSAAGLDFFVSFLVAAHNEEKTIAEKIRNVRESLRGFGNSEILVGADGCDDRTCEILAGLDVPNLKVVVSSERIGKGEILNRLLEKACGEITVFSDADALTSPDAVSALARHFADPAVAVVCGKRSQAGAALSGMGLPAAFYNIYEGAIKRGEGVLSRVIGADGCLYAARSSFLKPVPPGVPDDFFNTLRALEAGKKVLYDPAAVAYEMKIAAAAADHFTRKRRTVARGALAVRYTAGLLNPLRFPLTCLLLFSHKVLRWLTPFALAGLFLAGAALCGRSQFYAWAFAAQLLFYGLALAPSLVPSAGRFLSAQMCRYFLVANAASAAGVLDAVCGRKWVRWDRPG